MRRFLALVCASLLAFVCFAPSFSADFANYPADIEDPYAVAPLSFDSPAVLKYKYYVDESNRPDLYVNGTAFWGLTGTNTWEHSQHDGRDYVTWATYRVNYQLYVNDDRADDTPFCMTSVRLRLNAPMSGTEVRVAGFSDNVNLSIQGLTDSNRTLIVDAYLRDTLVIPADSGGRVSFYIDFNIMFDPSKPAEELVNLSENNSPILPMMDGTGFQPRIYSYLPEGTVGSSSAAGQQQIDQSINAQTQQQQQQFDEFTQSGDDSIYNSADSAIKGKLGLFDSLQQLLEMIWDVFSAPVGEPVLTFPSFSLEVEGVTYQVWQEQTFNFNVLTDSWGLSALKTALNFATTFVVYAALLRYLVKVWEAIVGNKY